MPSIIGYVIVISVLAVIVFFCGRSVIRSIRAELRGEGSCAGCSKAGSCAFANGKIDVQELLKKSKEGQAERPPCGRY